tara:strand:+ start:1173 stop:1664 length:492 start_codon:yes stop_codon:yes gene_type:complete
MKPKHQQALLLFWHAWLGGAYLVAYLTADEDTYGMHLFAGYAVLAAIVARLLVGLMAPNSKLFKLPRPRLGDLRDWFRSGKGRHPVFAWFASVLLIVVGASAATGALSDSLMTWLEDPHEAISEASLWVIFGHIAFVTFMYGGKKFIRNAVVKLSERLPFTHA